MRRRPQPNPRRGILRAAAVALLLIVLAVATVLIASSFAAPPANAPTIPSTPAPIPSPPPRLAPSPSASTRTGHHPKKGAFSPTGPNTADSSKNLYEREPSHLRLQVLEGRGIHKINVTPAPSGPLLVYFERRGHAAAPNPLYLSSRSSRRRAAIGHGDPYVRPVWAPNGRYLMYVRVRETSAFPGALWELIRVEVLSRREQVIAVHRGLSLIPLGWSRGKILFLVGNATDTSLYSLQGRKQRMVSIVAPQPLTTGLLSPGGRSIGFTVPSNCSVCTLDLYKLSTGKLAVGPTGTANEETFTWTADGKSIVGIMDAKVVVVSDASLQTSTYPLPPRLPLTWSNPMQATVLRHGILFRDRVTGRTYSTRR